MTSLCKSNSPRIKPRQNPKRAERSKSQSSPFELKFLESLNVDNTTVLEDGESLLSLSIGSSKPSVSEYSFVDPIEHTTK